MSESESYRAEEDRSSPAPPALPERPPERFQFNLKHLLAFMFASAFVAMGLRQLLAYLEQLPDGYLAGWINVLVGALTFGALLYFFVRVPALAVQGSRLRQRWQAIRHHRRELEQWAKDQSTIREGEPENSQPPPFR
jgi:hypothetical protein